MKYLIKKKQGIMHGTIAWKHDGNDGQYCEAGEAVVVTFQPQAGWGLSELSYTDDEGNVVKIEGNEFVMPDSNVVIDAVFKRFSVEDWEGYEGGGGDGGAIVVSMSTGGFEVRGLNFENTKADFTLTDDIAGDYKIAGCSLFECKDASDQRIPVCIVQSFSMENSTKLRILLNGAWTDDSVKTVKSFSVKVICVRR